LLRGAFEKKPYSYLLDNFPLHGRSREETERWPAGTPVAGTRCWPQCQSGHWRAAARLRGSPLSLPYLSLSAVASNLSSILLFLVKLCFLSVDSGQGD
jgi:hypothetical protein